MDLLQILAIRSVHSIFVFTTILFIRIRLYLLQSSALRVQIQRPATSDHQNNLGTYLLSMMMMIGEKLKYMQKLDVYMRSQI